MNGSTNGSAVKEKEYKLKKRYKHYRKKERKWEIEIQRAYETNRVVLEREGKRNDQEGKRKRNTLTKEEEKKITTERLKNNWKKLQNLREQ